MAVFYREGETKKRPGVYQRHVNIGLDTLVTARDGICAIPIQANWGPLGVVLKNNNKTDLKKNYGDGDYSATFTVPAAKEMFNSGAVTVYTYRLGTGGKAASKEVTSGLTITAKYPGDAAISVAIQAKLSDSTKKEVLVYFGTSLVESIDFLADATNEGQNLCDAVNADSDYITATETPEGTLPTTVSPVAVASGALSGGQNPTVQNTDYSNAFDAFEPYYFNTIALDKNDDASLTLSKLLHEYIKNAYTMGKLCIGVVGETSAVDFEDRAENAATFNDNKMVYLGNGYKAGNENKEGCLAICRTAGLIASTPSNQGITHLIIDEATDLCETLTYAQYEQAVDAGMLLFSMDPDGSIWYDTGINTLVNPDEETQDNGWKKIRRTKVRFEIIDRLDRTLGPKVGRVSNDSDGIADIIQSGQRVLDAMSGTEGKLYAGAEFVQDPDMPSEEGDSGWFIVRADDIDSLEKIYLQYQFRYSKNV